MHSTIALTLVLFAASPAAAAPSPARARQEPLSVEKPPVEGLVSASVDADGRVQLSVDTAESPAEIAMEHENAEMAEAVAAAHGQVPASLTHIAPRSYRLAQPGLVIYTASMAVSLWVTALVLQQRDKAGLKGPGFKKAGFAMLRGAQFVTGPADGLQMVLMQPSVVMPMMVMGLMVMSFLSMHMFPQAAMLFCVGPAYVRAMANAAAYEAEEEPVACNPTIKLGPNAK
eukprot:gnl/TRDRNA2_/TRDRNA2_176796_c0_seq10.p1 gnl/TRDRNA2_/TRDRNA2_176796_c0~~gnl/TRDRNA2_/TRDRNA2_176796_c0_seq10.p1  ORF type:complete len:229 (-),score=50.55 gnl/TRDRNA2_/TRDRNA2_176796_c0_seq10:269-955(-)